jgi:TRAP transporter TAXI family solute receptor
MTEPSRARATAPAAFSRRLLLAGMGAGLIPGWARAAAESMQFFRIGTGATAGTYFPLGGEIASALSNPPGSRPCDRGGACGIPGMIAVAQATQGSVENLDLVLSGALDSALCQADVAAWAFHGDGLFGKKGPQTTLRSLANLYAESLHVVVRADGPIKSFKDLKGKRISLGEPESGTLVDAKAVLSGFKLSEADLKANYMKLSLATQGLADGTMDGFFQIGGWPIAAISDLAATIPIRLLSIPADVVQRLQKSRVFFTADKIPAGTYSGIAEDTATLGIGADWVATQRLSDDLAYALVRTLWHPSTRHLLDTGHPIGKRIFLAKAVDGLGVPLHPGAMRYYKEIGLTLPTN